MKPCMSPQGKASGWQMGKSKIIKKLHSAADTSEGKRTFAYAFLDIIIVSLLQLSPPPPPQ